MGNPNTTKDEGAKGNSGAAGNLQVGEKRTPAQFRGIAEVGSPAAVLGWQGRETADAPQDTGRYRVRSERIDKEPNEENR